MPKSRGRSGRKRVTRTRRTTFGGHIVKMLCICVMPDGALKLLASLRDERIGSPTFGAVRPVAGSELNGWPDFITYMCDKREMKDADRLVGRWYVQAYENIRERFNGEVYSVH